MSKPIGQQSLMTKPIGRQPNSYKMQQEATSTPAAKRPKPSDTLFMKALSAIQSARPEALSSTYSNKYAKDHGFVIVGVRLDRKLDEVKAAINKTYPAKMSLVRIRSRATQAPTRLVRAFPRCETTMTLLIDRGLMIRLTHHRCQESRQAQPSSPPPGRDVVIQCHRCQGFGHKANACIQEARCIRCGGNHKVAECAVSRDKPKSANCKEDHAASYKGCSKYQDKLSANRPLTVRGLSEILATATQIVADAVIHAKTIRHADFSRSDFRQECKERQDHHYSNLLRKLLKVPPEPNEQDDLDCEIPLNE